MALERITFLYIHDHSSSTQFSRIKITFKSRCVTSWHEDQEDKLTCTSLKSCRLSLRRIRQCESFTLRVSPDLGHAFQLSSTHGSDFFQFFQLCTTLRPIWVHQSAKDFTTSWHMNCTWSVPHARHASSSNVPPRRTSWQNEYLTSEHLPDNDLTRYSTRWIILARAESKLPQTTVFNFQTSTVEHN